jgi:hypothetical protein
MPACEHQALDDLLPHLADVTIDRVELAGGGVRIWARRVQKLGRVC